MRKLTLGVATSIYSRGYKPSWISKVPRHRAAASNPTIFALASNILNMEVQGLLKKGAICKVGQIPGQYVSSYFTIPKSKRSPDKWRLILNLKKFNK